MTREDIEKIVTKTVEWLNGYAFTDDDNCAHVPTLIHDFLKDSRTYFDDFVETSTPSNLDEIAELYALDVRARPFGNLVKEAFKAGAKWGTKQTMLPDMDLERISDEAETIANGIMIGVQACKYHTCVYDTKSNDFNHSHLMEAAKKGIEFGLNIKKNVK